jgi:hypothetical protein
MWTVPISRICWGIAFKKGIQWCKPICKWNVQHQNSNIYTHWNKLLFLAAMCKHLPLQQCANIYLLRIMYTRYSKHSFYTQRTNGWHWMQYKRSVTEQTLVSWTTRLYSSKWLRWQWKRYQICTLIRSAYLRSFNQTREICNAKWERNKRHYNKGELDMGLANGLEVPTRQTPHINYN